MHTNNRTTIGLPVAEPEEVGFSSSRLARIGPAMQKYIDARSVPGVLTLAARHGKIIHFKAQGLMDVEAGKPVRLDTMYRIMSMTKPITCVALLMLYEEGHFLLTDPISKWLPAFDKMMVQGPGDRIVPANRQITFRDCLTHTAGFSTVEHQRIRATFERLAEAVGKPASVNTPAQHCTVQELVDELSRVPLRHQPGTFWEYNPGHEVVGALVEQISGQTLEQFFQDRIFRPLNMVDTHFYVPEDKVPRFAAGYRRVLGNGGEFILCDSPSTSAKVVGPKVFFSGTGALVSTAADYVRFAQGLANGGELDGARILGRKTIELMTTNHTGDLPIYWMGPGYGYGLGVYIRTSLSDDPSVGSLGTYGWLGAYCTWYFSDPKEGILGLLFTQVRDFWQHPPLTINQDFQRMVYQALVE
jgi:CubicO group peptidase (beta-lactamase class C family)